MISVPVRKAPPKIGMIENNDNRGSKQRQQGSINAVGTTRAHNCQTEGLRKKDAELLVYLINEEMDIYIGIRRYLPP
jgi:hypothetical protein